MWQNYRPNDNIDQVVLVFLEKILNKYSENLLDYKYEHYDLDVYPILCGPCIQIPGTVFSDAGRPENFIGISSSRKDIFRRKSRDFPTHHRRT
jgi:hypothetical protein